MIRSLRLPACPLALVLLLLSLLAAPAGAVLPPWDFLPGFAQPVDLGPGETAAEVLFIHRNTVTCTTCPVNPPAGATCCTSTIFVNLANVPDGVNGCINTQVGCLTTPVPGDAPLVVLGASNSFVPGNYLVRVEARAFDGPQPRFQAEEIPLHLFPFSAQVAQGTKINQGQSASIPVTLVRAQGFTAPIDAVVVGGGIPGVSAQPGFDGNGDLSEVVIDTDADAAPGLRAVSVQLSTGNQTRTIDVPFEVVAPFKLSVSPSSAAMVTGGSKSFTATLQRASGFLGPITLSLVGAPSGLTANFGGHPLFGSSLNFTLSAAPTLAPGTYTATVQASGGGTVKTALLTVVVKRLLVSVNPTAGVLGPNTSQAIAVTIERGAGITGSLSLAATTAPFGQGVGASVLPTSTTGNSATLTLTASRFATQGFYAVTLTVSGPGVSETVAIPTLMEGSLFP